MDSYLIVIENGKLTTYRLDEKTEWLVGRASKDNKPDIKLHSVTVSRRHGTFKNKDGFWVYLDYNGKNGTVYNNKHIKSGIQGSVRQVMLNDGDVFIFGGSIEPVINSKTVWAMYSTQNYIGNWHIEDTHGCSVLEFISDGDDKKFDKPQKGTVVKFEYGMAIEAIFQHFGEFHIIMGIIVLAFIIYSIKSVGLSAVHIILLISVILGIPRVTASGALAAGLWDVLVFSGVASYADWLCGFKFGWLFIIFAVVLLVKMVELSIDCDRECLSYSEALLMAVILGFYDAIDEEYENDVTPVEIIENDEEDVDDR